MTTASLRLIGLAVVAATTACVVRTSPTNATLSPRRTTVVYESCTLGDRDDATLASASARAAIDEVVLSCASLQPSGDVTPAIGPDRDALTATVRRLQSRGYRVVIGVRALDGSGKLWDASPMGAFLADASKRDGSSRALLALAQNANGIEIALPPIALPASAKPNLTTWIGAVSHALRPSRSLGLFVPPSTTSPSDAPGGDAFDIHGLSPLVDRMRVMTLDYSCCGAAPGPGTDPTWTIAAASYVANQVSPGSSNAALDVAAPLYGTDFTSAGIRYVSWVEASEMCGPNVSRSPSPHCHIVDGSGVTHDVWFDDKSSVTAELAQLSPDALAPSVGILLYGLGAEDPSLWDALAQARQR